jgi:glycosyltransferase involved in cell wall biosynthesis
MKRLLSKSAGGMHIGLFSPGWPYGAIPNGIVTYVHWLRQGLLEHGHRVTVFTPDFSAPTPRSGEGDVYVVRRRRRVALKRWLLRRFGFSGDMQKQWADDLCAEVLSVHRRDPLTVFEMEESFGMVEALISARAFPVIVKLHGPAFRSLGEDEQSRPESQQKRRAEGSALSKADFITSPSQCLLDETVAHYSLAPAIAVQVVNPLAMSPDDALWSVESCDRDTVLFVGRFDLRKGADRVLHAFKSVLERRPSSQLVFIGPDGEITVGDGLVQKFEEFVRGVFTPTQLSQISYEGPMQPQAISRWRSRAMVSVVASRWESQGYTALEAMLQGCPVICADTSGLREVVQHGVNGLLFSGDSQDLASKILDLLTSPELAAQLGKRARQDVLNRHDPAKVALETVAVYRAAHANFHRQNRESS